jgi:hypothetical protein
LRAARPAVWISEVSERRKPSLSASRSRPAHLGQVETLAQQVDADEHVELAETQPPQDLDALEGIDVGVEILDAQAGLASGSR